MPDAPDMPDTPDAPNGPDGPDTPDTPNGPDTPDAPDLPSDRQGVTARLAACGLDCGRCLSHPQSPISRHAQGLLTELGGFAARAAFFARIDPIFESYAAFEAVAKRFAAADCAGCRTGRCLLGHCIVQTCVKERGVDFCYECGEFPCDHTGFPEMLHARWLENNQKMREMGPEAFLAASRTRPRY